MADAKKYANLAYKSLLKGVEINGWHCNKNDEQLSVEFGVNGDDLHMDFMVKIDVERQLVRLFSKLPFRFPQQKRLEGAVVTSVANYALSDGCFEYSFEEGTVIYKMTTTFRESVISPEVIKYLLNFSAWAVDKFNDQFLMVSNGALSVKDFIAKHL